MEQTTPCRSADKKCTKPAVLEIVLGKLEDHSSQPAQTVCSMCGAALLVTHGVFPEEAPASPFRVVRVRLLQQPAVNTPSNPPSPYPSTPSV